MKKRHEEIRIERRSWLKGAKEYFQKQNRKKELGQSVTWFRSTLWYWKLFDFRWASSYKTDWRNMSDTSSIRPWLFWRTPLHRCMGGIFMCAWMSEFRERNESPRRLGHAERWWLSWTVFQGVRAWETIVTARVQVHKQQHSQSGGQSEKAWLQIFLCEVFSCKCQQMSGGWS